MHPNPRRVVPVFIALAVLAFLAYWYFGSRPKQSDDGLLKASGTLEILQVQVGAELGGKVVEVRVAEGDAVKAGDILVQLDSTLLQAQRLQAEASLASAKANLDAAQANVESAQFAEEAAQAGVKTAQASLDLLLAGANAEQLAAAQAQLALAEANHQAAEASLAALTAAVRPEEVTAAHRQLETARQKYNQMTVVLSSQQITDVITARTTAKVNLEKAQNRLAELRKDSTLPASALEVASTAAREASEADQVAQAAQDAILDASLPFYRQLGAVRQLWNIAQLNLSQARARQAFLRAADDIPQVALEAADSAVEEAKELADDAQKAFISLDASPQGERLRLAWAEVQSALNALNRLALSGGVPLEAMLNQLKAASAQRDMASANLSSVQNGARAEQIDAAQAQLEAAKAQLEATQARTKAAQAQSEAARAQVELAQASLETLDVQISRLTITAPLDGVVLTRLIQPGEIAAPGAVLLILGQTAEKTITVYIPEDCYGLLSLGQPAEVTVDSFPGVRFNATVVHIADKAEFTPRNVQTIEGRKNTVFAVKLRVEDPIDRLKAGMPADVVFR